MTARAMPCGCEPYTGTVCQSHYQPQPAPEPGGAAPDRTLSRDIGLVISVTERQPGHLPPDEKRQMIARLRQWEQQARRLEDRPLPTPDLRPLEVLAMEMDQADEGAEGGLIREWARTLRAVIAQMKEGQS